MYLKQSQNLQIKELRKVFAKELGSLSNVSYEPGSEPAEPDWPFFLDFDNS